MLIQVVNTNFVRGFQLRKVINKATTAFRAVN